MNLTDINTIKALLGENEFRFSKSKGQNFLREAWVPEQIADEAMLDENTGVLEVGPGIGCLTVQLSRRAKKVVSVEIDTDLKPILAVTLADCDNTTVIFGDVMKMKLEELVAENFADCDKVVVCANLPYNITSPVLTKLTSCKSFSYITVMIQKEVAERICARENTADWGAFSVLMQWRTSPEKLFDVSPACFIPAPKVTSSVIRLSMLSEPPCTVKNEDFMFSLVRACFNMRRKTLSNAVCNTYKDITKEQVYTALEELGYPQTVRGEVLKIEDFAALSDKLR